jgi:uncharacterized NAD(P)/FAD-binding protein YdhS
VIRHVAIVGAGFSGTLQAINLLRHEGPRATLIERAAVAGEGLAYGAAHSGHVLNVRAGNMSAYPDEPDHFIRWMEARGIGDAGARFAPRLLYGTYLRELLHAAVRGSNGRLTVVQGDVIDAEYRDGACLTLADGRTIAADAAVLAVGNLPPHDPLPAGHLSPDRYHGDPWAPGLTDGLGADDSVLILGTGLTMVDIALLLDAEGFAGKVVALSRRGLLPRAHAPAAPWQRIAERPTALGADLVHAVRRRGDAIGWRNAVDELRPYTQDMWANADAGERARFLRHLRPWWDVHRHRLAPQVAERLAAMIARGQLKVIAGKVADYAERGDGVDVVWRPRGADEARSLRVQRIVNCTGPQGDLARTTDPLIRTLHARGLIRPDSARLGIDVDADARTIAANGESNDWLLALGPMTRGAFWEIVAVPDIRAQTWSVARRLSNAHWVGWEGL